jgi:hypothetical protein
VSKTANQLCIALELKIATQLCSKKSQRNFKSSVWNVCSLFYAHEVFVGVLTIGMFVAFDRAVRIALRTYIPEYEMVCACAVMLVAAFVFRDALVGVFHIAFVLVLPTAPCLVHAASRLRNVRNKVERLVATDTPMHILFRILHIAANDVDSN